MKREQYEDLFITYVEGVLPEAARLEFEKALTEDAELRASFDHYRALIEAESVLRSQDATVSKDFTASVMGKVLDSKGSLLRRLSMEITNNRRIIYSTMASAAVVTLALTLVYRQALQVDSTAPRQALPIIIRSAPAAPEDARLKTLEAAPQQQSLNKLSSTATLANPLSTGGVRREDASKGSSLSYPNVLPSGIDGVAREKKTQTSERYLQSEGRTSFGADLAFRADSSPYPREYENWQPPAPASKQYEGMQESSLVSPLQQSLSTFSIDVDTASYTNTRRFLRQWQLPPAEAVRTEEFLNYFKYNYPVQYDQPFNVTYEIAPDPFASGKYLLRLGVKARDVKPNELPWNIVFLVDTSGSMEPANRLPLIKQSMKTLATKMRPEDRLAIVSYAGAAGLQLDSTPGSERAKIMAAIDSLGAGGSTNGSAGIELAYSVAQQHLVKGGVNRVILATDGDFNVGTTDQHTLVDMVSAKRQTGISLTTIGVGEDNFKDATLEQLADKGNGNYFYLDSIQEGDRVFGRDLMGMVETVAKDVKLQLEFNPRAVSQYRLLGYENRTLAKEDFNNDAVDAGEIGSGHTVTAVYEIVLNPTGQIQPIVDDSRYQAQPTAAPTPEAGQFANELAFVKIRFKEPNGDVSKLSSFSVTKDKIEASIGQSSDDFRFAAAVAGFAQSLRGTLSTGAPSLKQVLELAQGSRGTDELGQRQEFIDLVRAAATVRGENL